MINVTLYKDAIPDNNRNSISGCANIEQQKQYFNNLNKIIINQERMTWNEPFIVYHNQGDLWEYQYGSFDYKDRTYYFSIDQIEPINDNKSQIDYRIDWLETLKYEITFNNSYIFSSNKEINYKKDYYEQFPNHYVYEPLKTYPIDYVTSVFTEFSSYALVFIQHNSTSNKDVIAIVNPKTYIGQEEKRYQYNLCNTISIQEDLNGALINKSDDIYGLWIIPAEFAIDLQWTYISEKQTYHYIYITDTSFQQEFYGSIDISSIYEYIFDRKPNDELIFVDNFGGTIWEQPFNQIQDLLPTTENTIMKLGYNINFSQFTINCSIKTTSDWDIETPSPSEFSFTYNPILLDTTSDTYQTYVYLQRQQDIDLRNLNMNKNLVKGLGSAQQSAMFGGLMGNQFGRELGMKKGQAIGGIGELVTTFTDYQTEQYFAPMEQKIIDKQYMRQDDSITQGSQGFLFQFNGFNAGFYRRTYDRHQNNSFESQFNFYGYKYNQVVAQNEMQEVFNKSITENEFSHLKQDVTLVKNYNDEIRKQIHQRLYNGISFNVPNMLLYNNPW